MGRWFCSTTIKEVVLYVVTEPDGFTYAISRYASNASGCSRRPLDVVKDKIAEWEEACQQEVQDENGGRHKLRRR